MLHRRYVRRAHQGGDAKKSNLQGNQRASESTKLKTANLNDDNEQPTTREKKERERDVVKELTK